MRRTDHQWEFAKWAAVVCMLLNHIALAWPPPWAVLGSAIGSVSFPVFSLLIVFHLRHDPEARAMRYLGLLLFWGGLAQPVYALLLADWHLWRFNAMATLASGVCLIYLAQIGSVALAGLAAGIVVAGSAWLDGGAWMPVAQLLAWYWLKRRPGDWPLAVVLVSALAFGMNNPGMSRVSVNAIVALLVTPWVIWVSPRWSAHVPRLPRMAFYSFYPLHLAAILAVHGSYR